VVISLGADIYGVLAGRVAFALAATAAISALLRRLPDRIFLAHMFRSKSLQPE